MAGEFALVAVDRQRVRTEAERGRTSARRAQALLERLSFHLSGAQLGITVTSLMLGLIAEPTIARALEPVLEPLVGGGSVRGVSIGLALALATVVQMVLGELVPKNLAIARPQPTALALARPFGFVNLVLSPLIHLFNNSANWTVRRLGIEPQEELVSVRSLEELELLIRSSGEEGGLDHMAFSLLTRSIRFGDKTAADALVPRVSITALSQDQPARDLVAAATETGHSRFPVYGRDIDDVVGVVHVKDLLRLAPEQRSETPVSTFMRDAVAVPETRDLESILSEMRTRRQQLVVVVDEYGGTAGILTVEDILEEIVGDIEDEYDPVGVEAPATPPPREGCHVADGTLHLDEVLDRFDLDIPEGDYETVAGFVLARLGHIPEVGERLEYAGWTLEVLELDRRRISRLLLCEPLPGTDIAREPER